MLCSQRVSYVTLVVCLVIGNWRGPNNREGGDEHRLGCRGEGIKLCEGNIVQKIGQSVDDGLNLWGGDHNS